MNIGVFAMDPGGSTGLCWAILDPRDPGGAAGSLRNKMNFGSATVVGSEREQITEISGIWSSFYRACVKDALLPPENIWLVCENFVMIPGQTSGGEDSTRPLGILWGVEGYRMGRRDEWKIAHPRDKAHMPPMILQMAGQASTHATNSRLKEWGLWIVGREHERSAARHLALFLSKYKQQFP